MSDLPLKQSCSADARDELDAVLAAASLPSPPKIALLLLKLCSNPSVGAREIAGVIETDPTLAARLIRLANTAHYGAGIPVTNIQAATVRLGTDKITSVALAFEIAGLAGTLGGGLFDLEAYWRASVVRGCIARAIAMNCHRGIAGEAFLVGLLQDLGTLALAEHRPEFYGRLLLQCGGCQLRLATLETQAFSFNHIHVVTRLFQQWNMPVLLSDAIGRHHTRPPLQRAADPALRLWQIAYLVGALPIGDRRTPTFYDPSLPAMMQAAFDISAANGARLFRQAEFEFQDIEELFRPFMGGSIRPADLMAQAADLLAAKGSPTTPDDEMPAGNPYDRPEATSRPRDLPAITTAVVLDGP